MDTVEWSSFVRTDMRLAIFSNCPLSTLLGPDPNHFDEIFHEDLPIVSSVGSSALLYCSNRGDEQFVSDNQLNFRENRGLPKFTRSCLTDNGKPLTSLTVIPSRPSSAKAVFTSSNLNGLM